MTRKYWLIELSDGVRQRASREQLELATIIQRDGLDYLLYRDGFVAYKAATQLGAEVSVRSDMHLKREIVMLGA